MERFQLRRSHPTSSASASGTATAGLALTTEFRNKTYGNANQGQRAVIQLQWDATNLDLKKYPDGRLQFNFRGGEEDTCAGGSDYFAAL